MSNRIILLMLILGTACSPKQGKNAAALKMLDSPAQSGSAEPFLFAGPDSTIYLSWIEKADKAATLRFSRLIGDQWSDPVDIASGTSWFVNWADYPMMAMNGDYLMAHFLDKTASSTYAYDIKFTMSGDRGNTWFQPQILNDDQKNAEHGFVTLLPFNDNFFVTWLDGRNTAMEGMEGMEHEGHHGSMSLRAAIIDHNGNKLNEWELDNKTCDCCQTSAAITAQGPVVVYRDRSDDEIRDMSIVRLVEGQWTTPRNIYADDWQIKGCPVNGPRVAARGNDLAVSWYSAANDTSRVNVIFSHDNGATFGDPLRVDEGKATGRVDLEWIDDSSVMVSWMEGTTIQATEVYTNGSRQPPIQIATSSESRSSGFPQMTRLGDRFYFAWTDDRDKNIKVASLLPR